MIHQDDNACQCVFYPNSSLDGERTCQRLAHAVMPARRMRPEACFRLGVATCSSRHHALQQIRSRKLWEERVLVHTLEVRPRVKVSMVWSERDPVSRPGFGLAFADNP
jgi:hypothetical protein